MTIQPRSLRPTLGPLPCIACRRPVVWGVATHLFPPDAQGAMEAVRRRDLYDVASGHPHRCAEGRPWPAS